MEVNDDAWCREAPLPSFPVGSFVGAIPGDGAAAVSGHFPSGAGRLVDVAAVPPDEAWIVGHRTNPRGICAR